MADYKKMYAVLCAAIDGVIDDLERFPPSWRQAQVLRRALWEAEAIYTDSEED